MPKVLAENVELFCSGCRNFVRTGRDWPDPDEEQLKVGCAVLIEEKQEAAVVAKRCARAVNSSGTPGVNIAGQIRIRG